MSNIVEADYTIVQERTLPVIIGEIKIIEQNVAKTAMEGAIQIGQRLQEAKGQVEHGSFDTWCQENLNYSRRTAERFMKIASEYGGENGLLANATTLSHLSISNALSLLKVPEEDREKFVEEHPVEDMTNKALEEEIRKLKEDLESQKEVAEEERKEDQKTIEGLHEEIGRSREDARNAMHEVEDLKRKLDEAVSRAADPKEIETLKKRLEKEKARADQQAKKLKEAEAGRQADIDAAIEKERQSIIEKVNAEASGRMKSITGENSKLKKQLEEATKKMERISKGSILQFKVMTDMLQDNFAKCGELILEEQDQEAADKMNDALKAIVRAFEEAL